MKEDYELKEEFYCIWDTPDPDEGLLRYNQWRHRCMCNNYKDAYKDLVRAVDNWQEEIFNYKGSPTLIRSQLITLLGR